MPRSAARSTLGVLLAVTLVGCSNRIEQAPAIMPSTLTPTPPTNTRPSKSDLSADFSDLSIDAGELGRDFYDSPDDYEFIDEFLGTYEDFLSDSKKLAFRCDDPGQVATAFLGLVRDEDARGDIDRKISQMTPEDLSGNDATGEALELNKVGDISMGFSGVFPDGGTEWHLNTLMYRDGDIFAYVTMIYEEGTNPPETIDDFVDLIQTHTDPVNAGR